MTKCTFHKFGASGDIETHDALCILPLNIFNEKERTQGATLTQKTSKPNLKKTKKLHDLNRKSIAMIIQNYCLTTHSHSLRTLLKLVTKRLPIKHI
jgi:ABC-type phosphate/phosphonate transport system ATPase subunit